MELAARSDNTEFRPGSRTSTEEAKRFGLLATTRTPGLIQIRCFDGVQETTINHGEDVTYRYRGPSHDMALGGLVIDILGASLAGGTAALMYAKNDSSPWIFAAASPWVLGALWGSYRLATAKTPLVVGRNQATRAVGQRWQADFAAEYPCNVTAVVVEFISATDAPGGANANPRDHRSSSSEVRLAQVALQPTVDGYILPGHLSDALREARATLRAKLVDQQELRVEIDGCSVFGVCAEPVGVPPAGAVPPTGVVPPAGAVLVPPAGAAPGGTSHVSMHSGL